MVGVGLGVRVTVLDIVGVVMMIISTILNCHIILIGCHGIFWKIKIINIRQILKPMFRLVLVDLFV